MAIESGFSIAAAVIKALDAFIGLISRLRNRLASGRPGAEHSQLDRRERPLDFQLFPISFELCLSQAVPEVQISLQAINFRPKLVTLVSLQVNQFHASGCPVLQNITTEVNITLPPRQSRQVLCRRQLTDSEIRAVAAAIWKEPYNATIILAARYLVGKAVSLYGPSHPLSVNGRVTGAPNESALRSATETVAGSNRAESTPRGPQVQG